MATTPAGDTRRRRIRAAVRALSAAAVATPVVVGLPHVVVARIALNHNESAGRDARR
jgi:hypothetical protein